MNTVSQSCFFLPLFQSSTRVQRTRLTCPHLDSSCLPSLIVCWKGFHLRSRFVGHRKRSKLVLTVIPLSLHGRDDFSLLEELDLCWRDILLVCRQTCDIRLSGNDSRIDAYAWTRSSVVALRRA
ncbi:uncharacterized protein STEHIDRAFT_117926 [Stereum hirsutum FP-91666 SS1]|uniref:uncharacterized protein n=1 Tax=Stereum hirsutum (strain FP-91666) TaxID=721885 RepID=UPI000440A138|nr:uncharacterized protein STEHIDRAFT_117926 [Stereum hirsutum FP-91666 SS1]EIM90609.1 hypothetical protein STEHIDRAFT_117926 [Stereum hirsutum FP-91666 SS1]